MKRGRKYSLAPDKMHTTEMENHDKRNTLLDLPSYAFVNWRPFSVSCV